MAIGFVVYQELQEEDVVGYLCVFPCVSVSIYGHVTMHATRQESRRQASLFLQRRNKKRNFHVVHKDFISCTSVKSREESQPEEEGEEVEKIRGPTTSTGLPWVRLDGVRLVVG